MSAHKHELNEIELTSCQLLVEPCHDSFKLANILASVWEGSGMFAVEEVDTVRAAVEVLFHTYQKRVST